MPGCWRRCPHPRIASHFISPSTCRRAQRARRAGAPPLARAPPCSHVTVPARSPPRPWPAAAALCATRHAVCGGVKRCCQRTRHQGAAHACKTSSSPNPPPPSRHCRNRLSPPPVFCAPRQTRTDLRHGCVVLQRELVQGLLVLHVALQQLLFDLAHQALVLCCSTQELVRVLLPLRATARASPRQHPSASPAPHRQRSSYRRACQLAALPGSIGNAASGHACSARMFPSASKHQGSSRLRRTATLGLVRCQQSMLANLRPLSKHPI